MEPIYKQTFLIDDSRTDDFGRATPAALLYFAQEAAGAHCSQLGVDRTFLEKKNLFWAIIRNRTEILRLPQRGETVTVETWPMPTTRSSFPRATAGYDEKGNLLFRIISLWVLMDVNSRAMVLPGKSGIHVEGILRGNELPTPGSISPKDLSCTLCRKVGAEDLDQNGHMNNTRYLDWLTALLDPAFCKTHCTRGFCVCYLSEAREGETVQMHYQLSHDGILQAVGCRKASRNEEKPERIFTAQVYF